MKGNERHSYRLIDILHVHALTDTTDRFHIRQAIEGCLQFELQASPSQTDFATWTTSNSFFRISCKHKALSLYQLIDPVSDFAYFFYSGMSTLGNGREATLWADADSTPLISHAPQLIDSTPTDSEPPFPCMSSPCLVAHQQSSSRLHESDREVSPGLPAADVLASRSNCTT